MSIFSSLQWGGSGLSGGFYALSVDSIADFGWSLLPQYPGSFSRSLPSGTTPVYPERPVAVIPPLPVAYEPSGSWGIEAEETFVPQVLARSTRPGPPPVPRAVVVVDDVSTEVEQHPEGDFPAGSIFAPGQTWGVSTDLDTAPDIQEDSNVALGDFLDWGLETLAGNQPWQLGGWGGVQQSTQPSVMNLVAPSGIPGQPSQVGGQYVGPTSTGDQCGNRRYVTLDRETGKISCKRRRRRRLLTNRDLADLASLKTITGGGAALNAAVIRAVR